MNEKKNKDQKFRQDTPKNQQGGNPRQHDDPSHDEHNDQNRVNQYGQEHAG